MDTKTKIICPICHHETCSCMLGDRRFLARQVGKLLRGGQDSDLATGEGRKGQPKDNGGTADDCFATPPWLVAALSQDYGDFGLDAAASHGHAVAERYYTAADDALRQDWAKDCDGKPVFMNPPFNDLERFVKKAYEESRRGAAVVCVLPFYKSHPWFREYVWQHAEVRMVQGQVVFQGFGPQEGECAGNRGRMQFDTVVAVFRPGRQASLGPYIDRLGNGQEEEVTSPDGRERGDNGTGIVPHYEDKRSARTRRREDPDGQEFDESAADDIKQVECPRCGTIFPI